MYEKEYQYRGKGGDAGAHQSLLDQGERFLHLLDDGIGNGHGVGAAAVDGVGLQAVRNRVCHISVTTLTVSPWTYSRAKVESCR